MSLFDSSCLTMSDPESADSSLSSENRSGGISEAKCTLDWSFFSVSLITIISFSSRFPRFKLPSELEAAASYGIKWWDSYTVAFGDFSKLPRLGYYFKLWMLWPLILFLSAGEVGFWGYLVFEEWDDIPSTNYYSPLWRCSQSHQSQEPYSSPFGWVFLIKNKKLFWHAVFHVLSLSALPAT